MDFTENLKLTLFTENDVTSWLGNYNNDMQKIDDAYGDLTTSTSVSSAEIKILQDKVVTLETTSAQHTDQLSVNTSSIAANALEIQTLETRENVHYNSLTDQIDALAESGESNLDAIKVLQSNVQTIRDIAAVNSSSISKMQLRVDALESGSQDFEEETRQTLEDHTTRIGDLESGLVDTDAIAREAKINAELAVTTSSVASAQVTALNTTVEEMRGDLDSAESEINTVKEASETNAANIVTLNASVANNTASISANQMEIASLDTRIESLEDGGNASELTQRVDALETWKTSASTDITTAQTTADSAKTVAENVQSQVSGIKSGAAVPFSFGTDSRGNYGYIKAGADTVTPFNQLILLNELDGEVNGTKFNIDSIRHCAMQYPARYIVLPPIDQRPYYVGNNNNILDIPYIVDNDIRPQILSFVRMLEEGLGLRAYITPIIREKPLIVIADRRNPVLYGPVTGIVIGYKIENGELFV